MTENLNVDLQDGILSLELRRTDKKNALTGAMYNGLADALRAADGNPAVRVILIHGQADCFTAGNDLADFLQRPPTLEDSPAIRYLRLLSTFEKPVVAAVGGVAVGIGTTMLMHCDIVVAADNARFQLPFAALGLCPEGGSSLILPRLAGYQRAAELLLLGEAFNAEKAREIGLANAVTTADKLLEDARNYARRLAAMPAGACRATKRLLRQANGNQVDETLTREARLFGERLQSPEAKEAFAAFLEKRKPDFSRFD